MGCGPTHMARLVGEWPTLVVSVVMVMVMVIAVAVVVAMPGLSICSTASRPSICQPQCFCVHANARSAEPRSSLPLYPRSASQKNARESGHSVATNVSLCVNSLLVPAYLQSKGRHVRCGSYCMP